MALSEDGSHDGIMSERTLNIAGKIYAELQTMIRVHGDEVIAELMPLIVSVLEELDIAFLECDEAVLAIEELRDELSQTKQEMKRQRQLRELIEEEKTCSEETLETQKKRLSDQHEQLHSLNKSMTLNLSSKKEYIQSLEGRMVVLEKDHRDLERRHIDTVQQLVKTKKTVREQSLVIEQNNSKAEERTPILKPPSDRVFTSTPVKMQNFTSDEILDVSNKFQEEEDISGVAEVEEEFSLERAPTRSMMRCESEEELDDELDGLQNVLSQPANTQNLFDELNGIPVGVSSPAKHQALIQEATDFLSEPSSRRSSVFSAGDNEMQSLLKEKQDLEFLRNKLMKDNNELLTKLQQSESTTEGSDKKITALESENKNIFEKLMEMEMRMKQMSTLQHPALISKPSEEDHNSEKRFTRSEMDKVIREKNLYKEKYLELQEDLSTRYVEVQQESTTNEKSKFWALFNGLFARKRTASEPMTDDRKVAVGQMKKLPDMIKEDNKNKLARQKAAMQSRHFIQGWSLPHDVASQSLQDMDFIQSIPAPIYCGPLGSLDNERKSLVRCCATANDDDPLTTRYMTWVCCEREGQGEVYIVDPANPTEIKQTFVATKSSIICIAYVPAAEPLLELEMVNLKETAEMSDSDNESSDMGSANDNFEYCSTNQSDHLLLHKPTFWLGTQSGFVAIHSSMEQSETLLSRVRLKDSILEIRHIARHNVVMVGCADSSVAIFNKYKDDGHGWNMNNYKLVMLGKTMQPLPVSVIAPVGENIWIGYGGNIAVLSLPNINIKENHVFAEGERALVTHMVPLGTGVWIACRFSSVLTLLDSNTMQPLQQVNMEEVLKPVSVSYGFTTLIRVSAVLCYNNLLWIGTSQGAMVTIPLKSLSPASYVLEPPADQTPMFAVRDEARISLHGHQGAVRYIIVARYCMEDNLTSLPRKMSNSSTNSEVLLRRRSACTRIVLSGGEGYISYRDMDAGTLSTIRRGRIIRGFTDHCHMIAWDVSGPRTIVS
ncbi:JNK-interacting protein 3-like isoform X4 [Bolinopsis microptera]|uniref:JNK-interacting protein 3-like isoform X4 n=1 Tax=Bolinopsis microptera TaxID=2820187 RepID=UPI003079BC3C